jgi:CRISPR-associated endonuclease Csn1
MLVSYKISKEMQGQLHEESFYRKLKDPKDPAQWWTDGKGKTYYAINKDLADMNKKRIKKRIKKIIDDNIRYEVRKAYEEEGEIPNEIIWQTSNGKTVPIKSVRIKEAKSSKTMKQIADYNKYVPLGSNHHMALYRNEDDEIETDVVSLFKAAQRKQNGEPIIQKEKQGKEFINSFAAGEMILWEPDGQTENRSREELSPDLFKVRKMNSNKLVVFTHHLLSNVDPDKERAKPYVKSTTNFNKHNVQKIRINPIGHFSIAND